MQEFSDLRNELLLETSKLLPETLQRRGPVLLRFPWAKISRRKVVRFCNNLRRIFSVGIRRYLEKNLAMKKLKKERGPGGTSSFCYSNFLKGRGLGLVVYLCTTEALDDRMAAESRKQGRTRTLPLAR